MDINALQSKVAALPATAPAAPADKAVENRELVQAVKAVNGSGVLGEQNELLFQRDPETHRMVMRVVDRKTKEVISQVPAEYVLRLAEDLKRQGE